MNNKGVSGSLLAVGLVVLAVAALLVLSALSPPAVPFNPESAAPDGYKALALLLKSEGVSVDPVTAEHATATTATAQPGLVLFIPAPQFTSAAQLESFEAAASAGATVVFGEPRTEPSGMAALSTVDSQYLASTPADPVPPGFCNIAALQGLGPIDAAFAVPIQAGESEPGESCYGLQGDQFLIRQQAVGTGKIITLASPYLWVNARLQPDKESGGLPLDNAATALRLLLQNSQVTTSSQQPQRLVMVSAQPSDGVAANGTQTPIQLLPTGVKLFLIQLAAAFCLFAWWKGRRLGKPISETTPVEIAGSELVVAVGDLLRRKGNPERAAKSLRRETCRVLCSRLGLPPDVPKSVLALRLAQLTSRDQQEILTAIQDGPVTNADALVRLARTLNDIRQEALHVPTH